MFFSFLLDITFGVTAGKNFAKLSNCNHNIIVDNSKLVQLLKDLKDKHSLDVIAGAEIVMSEYDLARLVDSLGDVLVKKWRRHSFICP
jgi:hypothetical protein